MAADLAALHLHANAECVMTREELQKIDKLSATLEAALHGQGPVAQGFSLAEMVALFVAGHPDPKGREYLLKLHLETVRSMLPDMVKRVHGIHNGETKH
jgi:hypothetical protein